MKKISTLCLAFCFSVVAFSQSSYSGNGGIGFGGAIGQSTLTITEDATSINFNLAKGASGTFSDEFVIYIDAINGGDATTSNYIDNSDPTRTAISGLSSGNIRSILNFPTGFQADYAIALGPINNFSGLYVLNTTGNHSYSQSAGLLPAGSTTSSNYTFSVLKANLGLSNPATFKFIGTYLMSGTSASRSNEGYGMFTTGSSTDANGNPGYSTIAATSFFTYPLSVLPVKLLSFTGSVIDSKGKLNWQVANDDEVSKYEIEKSTNGKEFTAIQTVAARRTSALQNYATEDTKLSGTNYYRLKTIDLQGLVNYSKIVQLSLGVKGQGFTIFPNPVMQTLNIKMAKLEKGQYDVNVYSAAGQLVFAKAIQYDGSGNTIQVELPGNMQRGNYNCILNSAAGKFTSSFLKQ